MDANPTGLEATAQRIPGRVVTYEDCPRCRVGRYRVEDHEDEGFSYGECAECGYAVAHTIIN